MNLHEFQAKKLFKDYNLPVPQNAVIQQVSEIEEACKSLGIDKYVAKCQVHAGGRGKAGGVRLCDSINEVTDFANEWLGKQLVTYQTDAKGQLVQNILIEDCTAIANELYLGAVVDRGTRSVVFMASTEGGVDIEKIAEEQPHLIHKTSINMLTGPQGFQGRELAFKLGLSGKLVHQFAHIFVQLAKLFIEKDLALLEVNPLVITKENTLLCLDGKITIDSNALYRQKEVAAFSDPSQEDEREAYAESWGLNYVALDGEVGCMVNGAGLAMGTMDMIKLAGSFPANFLDVGGTATAERVTEAFKIILSDSKVKAVLVNIFGGIVRCDLIADGIIKAIEEVDIKVPVVVRLEGNNAQLGVDKLTALNNSKIVGENDLLAATQKVVALVRG